MKLTFVCASFFLVLIYLWFDYINFMIFLPLETSCIEHWPVSILTSLICKVSDLINSLISQFEFVRNKTWTRLFVKQKVDLNFYLQKQKE